MQTTSQVETLTVNASKCLGAVTRIDRGHRMTFINCAISMVLNAGIW